MSRFALEFLLIVVVFGIMYFLFVRLLNSKFIENAISGAQVKPESDDEVLEAAYDADLAAETRALDNETTATAKVAIAKKLRNPRNKPTVADILADARKGK